MKQRLTVGDVFRSPKLAFGRKDSGDSISIDGHTTTCPVTHFYSEDERVAMAAETGQTPPKMYTTDEAAYDPDRGSALFVVISARMGGGGTGMGPYDVYPDGWSVAAQRLDAEGKYDRTGEVVRFYQSGCFNCMVEPGDIEFVRKMEATFI
jgi:hypothetical protein